MTKHLLLKRIFACIIVFICAIANAQNWTWIKGTNTINQLGTYGTPGMPAASNLPGGRHAGMNWKDNNGNFWLFGGGGYSSAGLNIQGLNDLWKYDITTNNWTWMHGSTLADQLGTYGAQGVPAPANTPGGRQLAVTWVDNTGNLWLFGGFAMTQASNGMANDLWKYTIATNQWTWVKGSTGPNQAGVYGTLGVAAIGNTPGARQNAVSWTDNTGNLWLFGGNDAGGVFNDLWKYNVTTNEWTWMSGANTQNQPGTYGTIGMPAAGNVPGARSCPTTWTDNTGALWMFGGSGYASTGTGRLNDLWKYTVATGQWTWMKGSNLTNQNGVYGSVTVPAAANVPGGRWTAAPWKDTNGNLWLFGGEGYAATGSGRLNDAWLYNINTNQWAWIKGSSGANQVGTYGTQSIANAANTPGARWAHFTWVDNGGNFWAFGGVGYPTNNTSGYLQDLWKFNICISTPPAPVSTTPAQNQSICGGQTTTLSVSSGTDATNWFSSPSSTTIIGSGASFTTPALPAGTYTFYAEANGCQQSASRTPITVTVGSVPVVTANSGSICAGGIFTIQPNGASSYTISGGSATVTPLMNTSYSVTGAGPTGCLSNTAIINVTVNPVPSISVNSGSICEGLSFTMIPSGAISYTYSGGNAVVTPVITTTYQVSGENTFGCISAQTATIIVQPLPPVQITPSASSLLCIGDNATLTASGASSYTWSTASIVPNIVVNPTSNSVYIVTGKSSQGCTKTESFILNVQECTGINKESVTRVLKIYPNPGNGKFNMLVQKEASMTVLNAIGEVIYRSDLNPGLHKIDLSEYSSGIYFFNVKQDNSTQTFKAIKE